MTTQPEALRLADALTTPPDCTCRATSYFECGCDAIWPEQWIDHAAAELRRLHAENQELQEEVAELRAWLEVETGRVKQAVAAEHQAYEAINHAVENVRQEMKVKKVTMRLPEYDVAMPIIDAYSGHVLVGPVPAPFQRKPLTRVLPRKLPEDSDE